MSPDPSAREIVEAARDGDPENHDHEHDSASRLSAQGDEDTDDIIDARTAFVAEAERSAPPWTVCATHCAHGCAPTDKGVARCPAHDNNRASLTFAKGVEGVVVCCHAACTQEAVVEALGLKMADLFDDSSGNGKRREVASYDYTIGAGKLLFQVVRFDPKDFRQRRPDGSGGWVWKMGDVRRVLYRLPEPITAVKAGRTIHIPEGERDVATLVSWGLDATCNPGGAGKWRPEYSETLRGAHVVVIPDADKPGRGRAAAVAASLAGVAADVRTVELPGAKDATAWAAAGGTREKFEILVNTPPAPLTLTTNFLMTDGGNAERFARDHAGMVRYCGAWGRFLRWDETRWQANDDGAVERMAKATVRAMLTEAVALPDGDTSRKRAIGWAIQSDSRGRRDAMLTLAKSEPGIPVRPAELDTQPYLLNVVNGVLDLRDGRLLPHDPDLLLTKLAPVEYHPSRTAPLFDAYLERVLPDDPVRRFVQRFLGYCLTAYVSEQVLLFLYGVGANGKTTLVNVVMGILGDYAKQAAPDLLMQRTGDHHPTELADLLGARFVPTVEVQEGRRLAEVLVKQLSGGDRLKARYMRQDFWEFDPTHKLVLVANHKPVVRGTDYAIWRRILMVPVQRDDPAGRPRPAPTREAQGRGARHPSLAGRGVPGLAARRTQAAGDGGGRHGRLPARDGCSCGMDRGELRREARRVGVGDDLYPDYSRLVRRGRRAIHAKGGVWRTPGRRGFTAAGSSRPPPLARHRTRGPLRWHRWHRWHGSRYYRRFKISRSIMPKCAPPTPPEPPIDEREPGCDDE